MTAGLVVLREFSTEVEARLAASVLEANGIPADVIADTAGGTLPSIALIFPVRLLVRAGDAELARELLDTPAEPQEWDAVSSSVRLEHVAVWTMDVDRMCAFYEHYFGARPGSLYRSATRPGFSSCFLTFLDGGTRLELMTVPNLGATAHAPSLGYAHIAVTVGSRTQVVALTERMRDDGVRVVSAPRLTGDGYFESVVEDPDGNLVEITADA